jgi:Ion channel.
MWVIADMTKSLILKAWDSLIIFLSLYTVILFFVDIISKIPLSVTYWLDIADFTICILFIVDWIYYLIVAQERKRYLKIHFIDLLASIPFTQVLRPLRIARAIRVIRLLRLVRGVRGAERFLSIFMKNKARSAMTIYLTITTLIYFYGTLGIYNFESGVNKNISTFGDAMWMAFTTLTTVGYGDCYPTTGGGRLLCAVLVLTGMGLFSLFTAEFASYILKATKAQSSQSKK